MSNQQIFFSPNQHPPFHMGNGMALWWTYMTAKQRGCDFGIRYDDLATYCPCYQFTTEQRAQSVKEIEGAMELLGIKADFAVTRSSYKPMYDKLFSAFMASMHSRDWEMAKRNLIFSDAIRGSCDFHENGLMEILVPWLLQPEVLLNAFKNCCDFIARRVPVHIRGASIFMQSVADTIVMKQVLAWLGKKAEGYQGPQFVHLPMIYGDGWGVLEKTLAHMHDYWHFAAWAGQYKTVEERRRVLERMITDSPKDCAVTVDDVLPVGIVLINPDGTRRETYTLGSRFAKAAQMLRDEARPIVVAEGLRFTTPYEDDETRFWNDMPSESKTTV